MKIIINCACSGFENAFVIQCYHIENIRKLWKFNSIQILYDTSSVILYQDCVRGNNRAESRVPISDRCKWPGSLQRLQGSINHNITIIRFALSRVHIAASLLNASFITGTWYRLFSNTQTISWHDFLHYLIELNGTWRLSGTRSTFRSRNKKKWRR